MLQIALILAAVWGVLWALFLQMVPFGQFLAERRSWLTIVIGIGVDLLIAILVLDWTAWWQVLAIVAVSNLGIIARGVYNEWTEAREVIDGIKDQNQARQ